MMTPLIMVPFFTMDSVFIASMLGRKVALFGVHIIVPETPHVPSRSKSTDWE